MMRALIATAVALTTMAAHADDYARIPAQTRAQIKAKCVADYPGDYGMQDGCIIVQSRSDLAVEDYSQPAPPAPAPRVFTCQETADDAAQFMAENKDFYSAEFAVALDECIKTTGRKTPLGKRLRSLAAENDTRTPVE
jgi:hypothetical protein